MTTQDRSDFDFLFENSRIGKALKVPAFLHLDQPIGLWNYIRIANDIAQQVPAGRLLDWGCGYGQMTFLLKRRGFQVSAFDIGAPGTQMPELPVCRDLAIVRSDHPTALPFETGTFDTVLSCGVLEHVDEFSQLGNELISLHEIGRVLRPGGTLLIYQLPQKFAWQEAMLRLLKLGYAHPRRYTATEITGMLNKTGYEVQRLRRANLVPKNLTGMPNVVRQTYSRLSRILIWADGLLSQAPLLRQLAGVLEVTAHRTTELAGL